jgi:hypothetical protein
MFFIAACHAHIYPNYLQSYSFASVLLLAAQHSGK